LAGAASGRDGAGAGRAGSDQLSSSRIAAGGRGGGAHGDAGSADAGGIGGGGGEVREGALNGSDARIACADSMSRVTSMRSSGGTSVVSEKSSASAGP